MILNAFYKVIQVVENEEKVETLKSELTFIVFFFYKYCDKNFGTNRSQVEWRNIKVG